MTKIVLIATLFALPLAMSACDKPAETPTTTAKADMANDMAMPVGTKTGKGIATVTAIDVETSKITLDHEPVVELDWPAMTMGFGIKPDASKNLAVGDEVTFEFEWNGKVGSISKIEKRYSN